MTTSGREAARPPAGRPIAPRLAGSLPALALVLLLAPSCACPRDARQELPAASPESARAGAPGSRIALASSAFAEGEAIPARYTCDGADVSPPLAWQGAPEGARSLALVCDDPDAPMGTWVHWVLYKLPPTATGLPEGVPRDEFLPDGSRQGMSDFRRPGYGGPCPPPGKAHRYYFKLYALDATPVVGEPATKQALEAAMAGHILAEARLMGTYGR